MTLQATVTFDIKVTGGSDKLNALYLNEIVQRTVGLGSVRHVQFEGQTAAIVTILPVGADFDAGRVENDLYTNIPVTHDPATLNGRKFKS